MTTTPAAASRPASGSGRGAAELGLEGVVEEGQLGTLIRGDHPLTGERLRRRHPRARTITIERIDPSRGERRQRAEDARVRSRASISCSSVPKSVSLLHALGDEETRRAINEAHLSAWQAALVVSRGRGVRHPPRHERRLRVSTAGGFVAAAYQHRTSRARRIRTCTRT